MSSTQDDFKIRSIDIRHINPSIMEGESLITSLLGVDTAVEIFRYAPILVSAPIVSGPSEIPGTLSCFEGVYDSSPAPTFSYQWLSDGVPIAGETNKTIETYAALDSTEMTCEVTAVNTIGSLVTESGNGIVVTIIEPIDIWEQDFYSVTGLNQVARQNLMVFRNMVATGMRVDNRFDAMTYTGMALTGMQIDGTTVVYEADNYAITVPSFLEAATVVNGGAETGDLTGWTIGSGIPVVGLTGGNTGTYFFAGDSSSNTTIVMYQDVPIGAANHADVDNRLIAASVGMFTNTSSSYDYIEASFQFVDGTGNPIGSSNPIITSLFRPTQGVWGEHQSGAEDAPVGARSVRVTITMTNQIFNGIATQFDDVTVDLFKY